MAPYEPKIDSKEFLIPDAAQEVNPRKESAAESADFTIRLWNPERPAGAGSLSWKTESVLVYMIADLVSASQGHTDDSTSAMMAHFDSTGRALVAARRIQTAILEFVACRPGKPIAAAILIHQPATIAGGLSAGMAQGALRLAEPGQILLSEEAATRLQDTPGVELRPVPALTTGGEGQSGLAELVWTSPDQIARLKASLSSGQNREESAPMGATMIVNAPLAPAAQSGVGATGLTSQAATSNARFTGDLAVGRDASYQDIGDEEQPFLTRTRVILGVVAVVLVAALVWMFYPSRVTKPPVVHVPENPVEGNGGAITPTPQPNQPPSTTVQPPTIEPAKPVVVAKPVPPAKPPAEKHGKEKPPTAVPSTAPEEPQAVQSVEGMTAKDIPNLLQMARKDAGGGNYDKARREYRIVLQLQPSNTEAREGLRRLDVAQSDR